MSIDEFFRAKGGQAVQTARFGAGAISGRLVKAGGEMRVIVDHGDRRLLNGELIPVVWSYPIQEVELVRPAG